MTPVVEVCEAPGASAGEHLARAIAAVVADRGRCRLAVPGGSSPVGAFGWLAEHLAPGLTSSLVVTWVDERHLPVDEDGDWRSLPEQSNLRGTWEHWLSRRPVPPPVVPMAMSGSLDDAVARYADAFMARLGGLDVVLLGVGEDGHIASLFPGHPALEATGTCVAVRDAPKPPPERISLTLPVLEDVEHAVLVATGAGKADALSRALAGDRSLPLGRYRPRGRWHWFLDSAAAADLERTSA